VNTSGNLAATIGRRKMPKKAKSKNAMAGKSAHPPMFKKKKAGKGKSASDMATLKNMKMPD
jgi:hypothetical protein